MADDDDQSREEFNYCVWKYLLESGLEHSAFLFARESGLSESDIGEQMELVPPGALMKLVDMAVDYTKEELKGSDDIDMDIENLGIFEAASLLEDRPERLFLQVKPPHLRYKPQRAEAECSDDSDDEEMDEEEKPPVVTDEILFKKENVAFLDGHGYERSVTRNIFHPTDNETLVTCCILKNPGCIIWNLNTTPDVWSQSTILRSSTAIRYDIGNVEPEDIPEITCAGWSNKRNDLLALGDDKNNVRVFDRRGSMIAQTELNYNCFSISWSPANAPGASYLAVTDSMGTTHMYNMDDPVHGLAQPRQACITFHQSPGKVLFRPQAEGSFIMKSDKQVLMYDVSSGEPTRVFNGHTARINDLCLHSNGNLFASGSVDTTVKLWNTDQRLAHRTLEHKNPIVRVRFSPDERTLSAISYKQGALFYDLETGKTVNKIFNLPIFEHMEFSPNGQMVSIGAVNGQVFVYETNKWELVRVLNEKEIFSGCTGVSWSPDSKKFAAGYRDGSLLLFDMRK